MKLSIGHQMQATTFYDCLTGILKQ